MIVPVAGTGMRSEVGHYRLDDRQDDADNPDDRVRVLGQGLRVERGSLERSQNDEKGYQGHENCETHKPLMTPEPEVFSQGFDRFPGLLVVPGHQHAGCGAGQPGQDHHAAVNLKTLGLNLLNEH